MIRAYKLYTGSDGNSHFQKGYVSEGYQAKVEFISFKETAAYGDYDWHTAPTTQFVITLTGTLEFETATGEKFILYPGEVLIAMDVTGSGHKWKLLGNDPWRRAYITFDENEQINFVEEYTAKAQ